VYSLPPLTETGPPTALPLAAGGRPPAVPVRGDRGHRHGVRGVDGEEEASVGGRLQPEHTGGGRGAAGDGQHDQSAAGGAAHLRGGGGTLNCLGGTPPPGGGTGY